MPEGTVAYLVWESVASCPVCGSADRRTGDTDAAVVRCLRCGHRYVTPRPTQAEIARGYSLPNAYDDWVAAADARRAMWLRRFANVLGDAQPGQLLDIGAGVGTFLAIARDRGWGVEGTEVSSTAVAKARELHALVLHQGLVEDAAPPGRYDVICLWHVLEHLPDPASTLRHCRGLLNGNGRIVLAMPNDGDAVWSLTLLGNVVRRILGRPSSRRYVPLRPGVESHIQQFTPKSLRRLLDVTGYGIDRMTADDAIPDRSRIGSVTFHVRRLLSRLTPWNLNREILLIASPRGGETHRW